MIDFLNNIDQEALLFLNNLHSRTMDTFMFIASAKFTWVLMYAFIIFAVFKNYSLKHSIVILASIGILVLFCDQMCSSIIRPYVERLRPSNLENPISKYIHIVNNYRGGRYGFPSCHASNSFGLALFITLLFRHKQLSIFIWGWALLHSYTRIYLGVHYPGDIIVGGIVGSLGALFALGISYCLHKNISLCYIKRNNTKYANMSIVWAIYIGLGIVVSTLIYSFFR